MSVTFIIRLTRDIDAQNYDVQPSKNMDKMYIKVNFNEMYNQSNEKTRVSPKKLHRNNPIRSKLTQCVNPQQISNKKQPINVEKYIKTSYLCIILKKRKINSIHNGTYFVYYLITIETIQ